MLIFNVVFYVVYVMYSVVVFFIFIFIIICFVVGEGTIRITDSVGYGYIFPKLVNQTAQKVKIVCF